MSLNISGLQITYGARSVVEEFSLVVSPGEVVALMGPSGTGKTSILRCVVGLQVPQGGTVQIGEERMTGRSVRDRALLRRSLIGVTYQSPGLLPELSVEENVAITLLFDGTPRASALEVARSSLLSVGLGEHGPKRVNELSGGEAQRAALARALTRPTAKVFIADEPTANLDARNAMAIADLIVTVTRDRGLAAVIATHDDRVAARCDRILSLRAPLAA